MEHDAPTTAASVGQQDTPSESNDDQKTSHLDKDTTHVAHHLSKTAPEDVPDLPGEQEDTEEEGLHEGSIVYSDSDPQEMKEDPDSDEDQGTESGFSASTAASDREAQIEKLRQLKETEEQIKELRQLTETEQQAEAKDV